MDSQFSILVLWNLCSESVESWNFEILVEDFNTGGPASSITVSQDRIPFQIWYCELCVKKNNKGEAEGIIFILVFSSFLSVKSFLKIWANQFPLLAFESFNDN